ncbi:MAG: M23 family metallopeptidase [Bacilli bacterium]|nr:M23 family metallopeptidase [Bacilli bacterium]
MIKLKYPLNYIAITSGYKTENRPNHAAIDLGWNRNYGGNDVLVYAPQDGKVTLVVDGKDNNLNSATDAGNLVKIQHKDKLTTRVIHLKKGSIKVKTGDVVQKGQILARMNNSGYSFGPHLHYDVWFDGLKVNPILYTYYYDDQVVNPETLKKYKLLKYTPDDNLKLYDKVLPIKLVNWQGKSLIQYDKVYYITKLEPKRNTAVLSALRGNKYKVWARLDINNIKKVSD